MNVHIDEAGMRLEFDLASPVKIYVDGQLQGEAGPGCSGPKDLEEKLRCARASISACAFISRILSSATRASKTCDHRVPESKRETAYIAGFLAGLRGEFQIIEHDAGVTSRIAPDHKLAGPSYHSGYSLGEALYRALAISQGKDAPADSC